MGKDVDKAILKVAYILSSISGVEKAENKKVFREITKGFSWFSPGDPDTDKFVLGIIETTKELATLRQLYDENDYYAAFLSKLKKECETIKNDSKATARKAFVIWIAMCLADHDLSEMEQKSLVALQRYLNSNFKIVEVDSPIPIITSIRPMPWPLGKSSRTRSVKVPDEYVTDAFMKEALETITLLGELKAQIDATSDAEQKQSLQESFDIMQNQLKSKILND